MPRIRTQASAELTRYAPTPNWHSQYESLSFPHEKAICFSNESARQQSGPEMTRKHTMRL